ncbi:MAG: hypothetical protein JSU65_05270, partial [Candidatus Zixiibacteriota bacterium]
MRAVTPEVPNGFQLGDPAAEGSGKLSHRIFDHEKSAMRFYCKGRLAGTWSHRSSFELRKAGIREDSVRYILLIIVLFLSTAGAVHGQFFGRIYLGSVDGLINGRMPFEPVTFHFHYENYIDASVRGMLNGFRLSATDGVTWTGSYAMDPTFPVDNFDLAFSMAPYNWDGYDADTVVVSGAVVIGAGLPPLFHGPAVNITVDIDDVNSFNGETFCIDSASLYPSLWLWVHPPYVG